MVSGRRRSTTWGSSQRSASRPKATASLLMRASLEPGGWSERRNRVGILSRSPREHADLASRRRGSLLPYRPGGYNQRRAPRLRKDLSRSPLGRPRGGCAGGGDHRRRRGHARRACRRGGSLLRARAGGGAWRDLDCRTWVTGRHARACAPVAACPERACLRSDLVVERTIRILVADDHAVYREGLRAVLGPEPDMEVVGEAGTGKEVVERAAEIRPDAILMDIQMPQINGIEATRRILEANPHVGVVVLTMFEDDDSVFSAMRAGARGYVFKGAPPSEILKVLRAVAGGEAHYGLEIAERLMDFFSTPRFASSEETFPELSPREREILDLIAQGHSNAKIAARLYLSPRTVGNHISHIFTKLQVADRAHAIIRAREEGLGREDTS